MTDINIIVEKSGRVSIFIQQGTYQEGREKIERLLKELQLEGVQFDVIGDIEKHTHEKTSIHQQQQKERVR